MNTMLHLIAAALLLCATAAATQLDRIAAVANKDVVTLLELSTRVAAIKNQYRANPNLLPAEPLLQQQVLDALILESLQLQLAERGNLVLPESQIDNAIQNIAQNQKLSLAELFERVQQGGQSIADFRAQIRRELTINQLQRQIVGRQISVADSEIERFMQSQSGQLLVNTRYQLYYQRFAQPAMAEADALLNKLNAGASLANETDSRDLGLRTLAELPSLFATVTPVLAEGEAILLARDDALHLAQLVAKSEVQSIAVEEYRIRHILLNTDALLSAESARALLADLAARIDAGESMSSLADEFSQDNGTRGRGGELGWVSLDSLTPAFAEAARQTPPGELSAVVETPFGLHILRVEETRSRDVGVDVLKNQIRNQLYQQRLNEATQRWLGELRAESYVEVRL